MSCDWERTDNPCPAHGPDCTPEWRAHWEEFIATMEARFQAGHEAYGDNPGTFARPADQLLTEMREEAEDIIGWGFVARVRMKALEVEAGRFEETLYKITRAEELRDQARAKADERFERLAKLETRLIIACRETGPSERREFARKLMREHYPKTPL